MESEHDRADVTADTTRKGCDKAFTFDRTQALNESPDSRIFKVCCISRWPTSDAAEKGRMRQK